MKLNWAERWAVNNPLRGIQQQLEMYWFRRMWPMVDGLSILEVGCGRGVGAGIIHKAFKPSQLYIQDLDLEMILKAKSRHAPSEEEGVTPSVGDAASLSFKSCIFDAVFGFGVLHHVPEWRSALKEIARTLKSGGIYYMEELYPGLYQNMITKHILLHPKEDRFGSKDLREAFSSAGMGIKKSIELQKLGILAVAVKK